ncbi:hypothetical protein ScPMuIL_001531 [Solemya velum]
MAGHDHNLQHLQSQQAGTVLDQFVIGAGNMADPRKGSADQVPAGASKFFWGNTLLMGGFGYVEVDSSHMTVKIVDALGRILYTTLISPRQL